MRVVTVCDHDDWRSRARSLVASGASPADLLWRDAASAQAVLPVGAEDAPGETPSAPAHGASVRAGAFVPRRFLRLSETVACHRDASKWAVLYTLLWRLQREGRELLDVASDPDVHRAVEMAAQVRRDEHKMRAFVRFVRVEEPGGERYVAWHRPDHLIVRRAAPFFADRFNAMRWSILTPDLSVHWDRRELSYSGGLLLTAPPAEGEVEQLWRTYYAAVFNPARLNVRAMLREMPRRHWRALPEAAAIAPLVREAGALTVGLLRDAGPPSARSFLPDSVSIEALRDAAPACRGCDLHERATQVVFGEGPRDARLVLVGEQPGDSEDLAGRPFVGPAGEVLDRALAAAGIPREAVYHTNAVKHFAYEPRGKWRIHRTPRYSEMRACRPWLEAELQAIRPPAIVCLGSTAARALLGPQARVMSDRGRVIAGSAWAPAVVVTVHPSAVLRTDASSGYFAMLVADLKLAAQTVDRANGVMA